MNTPTATRRDFVESTALLADLLWLEYQDAAEEARDALRNGDKLEAIAATTSQSLPESLTATAHHAAWAGTSYSRNSANT